eukprot:514944_1
MSQQRLKKSKKKTLEAMSIKQLKKRIDVLNEHREQHHKTDRTVKKTVKKSNKKILISQIRLYESRRLTGDSGSSADEQQGVQVVFVVGQIVHAEDSGWYDAIIKEVGTNYTGERYIKIGYTDHRWRGQGYDKIWTENEWDEHIRDPKTKLPYSCSKDNVKLLKNDIKHKTNMVNS